MIETLFESLFRPWRKLGPDHRDRLERWHALPDVDLHHPAGDVRWVAVDVETSGLDPLTDRVLAIGAVPIESGRIVLGEAFHRVLRQQTISGRDNILVHGIGGSEQSAGQEPVDALLDFLDLIGKSPLVGFHAPFDAAMLGKSMRSDLRFRFRGIWLDLADLGPAMTGYQGARRPDMGLDDWLMRYGIRNFSRHDALADALATAQLFQVLAADGAQRGLGGAYALVERARTQALNYRVV